MTILAGFSASRQSDAPINLATRIALSGGETVVAVAIAERVVDQIGGDLDIPVVIHQAASVPVRLLELVAEFSATMVVVGSSSSGLLGRVTLRSVTDRMVHTAAVPVAITARGYPSTPQPLSRITAAYGGEADVTGLLATAADLAKAWSPLMRIVSFTVQPGWFGSTAAAEHLVVSRWAQRIRDEITAELTDIRQTVAVPDVDLVVGSGANRRDAVESVPWEPGDLLALGSGAAGQIAQVFLARPRQGSSGTHQCRC